MANNQKKNLIMKTPNYVLVKFIILIYFYTILVS